MKFRGKVEVIEELNKLLTEGGARIHRDGAGSSSKCFHRVFEIQLDGTLANVSLGFDYRINEGQVLVRDDKAWRIAALNHRFAILMSKLKPYYTPRERGEFLKAVDKLLGADGGELL